MKLKEIAIEVAKVVAIEINRNAIDKDAPMSQDEFKLFCTELVARSVAAVDAERGKDAVGVLCIDHFRDCPSMENLEFQPMQTLPPGQYPLFLSPTIPPNMALVPIPSTSKMDWAGVDAVGLDEFRATDAEKCFNAMVQAAGVTK